MVEVNIGGSWQVWLVRDGIRLACIVGACLLAYWLA